MTEMKNDEQPATNASRLRVVCGFCGKALRESPDPKTLNGDGNVCPESAFSRERIARVPRRLVETAAASTAVRFGHSDVSVRHSKGVNTVREIGLRSRR